MAAVWNITDIPPQHGRHVLITGANRGLGFETAIALAQAAVDLTLAVRNLDAGNVARTRILANTPNAHIAVRQVDMENLASIKTFADDIRQTRPPIDILIHNAAAILAPQGRTVDGFETHMAVNHIAPFALTMHLLAHMPATRIVNMSSAAHKMCKSFRPDDFAFNHGAYTPMEAYGRSKLAALLFTAGLNSRLTAAGGKAFAVTAHPGYSNTNHDKGGFVMRLATALFAQPPAMGALPALYAATMPNVHPGAFIGPGGLAEMRGYPAPAKPSAQATDNDLAEQLWAASARATGLDFAI